MKRLRALIFAAPLVIAASCAKNNLSKIPQITLTNFIGESVRAIPGDTVTMVVSFIDGDADLGVNPNNTKGYYDIYLKDSRYDTGYVGYFFPSIDGSAENPIKGIEGIMTFQQPGALIRPRTDSIHMKYGDTLNYEMYITDRARHSSNHIVTPKFIIRR